ncbi:MAG: hypothetical protein GY696_26350, partial [Gammaproteobacteria bacterium]|nr:hypothetical protein [Gammaproteobacteria bacterium]
MPEKLLIELTTRFSSVVDPLDDSFDHTYVVATLLDPFYAKYLSNVQFTDGLYHFKNSAMAYGNEIIVEAEETEPELHSRSITPSTTKSPVSIDDDELANLMPDMSEDWSLAMENLSSVPSALYELEEEID